MSIPREELRPAFRALTIEPLEDFDDERYVPHPCASAVAQSIGSRLDLAGGAGQIIFFSGHRGVGKSTELRRLASALSADHAPIHLSMLHYGDPSELSISGFLLAIAAATERVRGTGSRLREVVKQVFGAVVSEGTLSVLGVTVRREVLDRSAPELNTVLVAINEELDRIASSGGKAPLLLVDDLDKATVDQVVGLHRTSGPLIAALKCSSVHCVPMSMLQSPEISMLAHADCVETLDPIEIRDVSGHVVEAGVRTLGEVVVRRMPRGWLEQEALRELVIASGGILRDLISMATECLVRLDVSKADKIDVAMVREVIRKQSMQRQLRVDPGIRAALTQTNREKDIANIPPSTAGTLIDQSLVLAHQGVRPWYEVHPLLKPLVSE